MAPAATGVILTLHVAVTLGKGYGAAGLVGPSLGFTAVGLAGLLVAGAAWLLTRRRQQVNPLPVGRR